MTCIYTIGHGNQSVEQFISLLRRHDIAVVIDIRSAPYSAYVNQFNKREIESALIGAGITYIYAGDRLGGKPRDESLQTPKGVTDYERLGNSDAFKESLDWLNETAAETRLAIMCSEVDPFSCHRESLIGKKMRERGVEVLHIIGDGDIVVQEQGSLF